MTLQEIIDKVMAALEAAEAESPEPPIAAILDQALIQVALETARAAIVKRKQPNDFGRLILLGQYTEMVIVFGLSYR